MHICKIMHDNISMDRQNTLKRDNAYNMKHSSFKMYVLSCFSFNMKCLTRTDVHVQVGYLNGLCNRNTQSSLLKGHGMSV